MIPSSGVRRLRQPREHGGASPAPQGEFEGGNSAKVESAGPEGCTGLGSRSGHNEPRLTLVNPKWDISAGSSSTLRGHGVADR